MQHYSPGGSPSMANYAGPNNPAAAATCYGNAPQGFNPQPPFPPYPAGASSAPYPPAQPVGYPPAAPQNCNPMPTAPPAGNPNPTYPPSGCPGQAESPCGYPLCDNSSFPDVSVKLPSFSGAISFPGT